MAGKRSFGNPVPVSDLAGGILDPMLRRRTGMSLALVQSWEEIAGPRLAARSRPQKIQWPRRLHEDDPIEPATLVIACEGMAALHLQHETGEIIGRVNAFLGFTAIAASASCRSRWPPRMRGRGRRCGRFRRPRSPAVWNGGGNRDDGLRASLERLGASILGARK